MALPTTISFLVPAAGCGSRAGLGSNKILAPLHGRPVLFWTLAALADPASVPPASTCTEILVAARREEWPLIEEVFALFDGGTRAKMRVVEGGATRQDSVEALARAASGDFVAVHDAARPLIEPALIARVAKTAMEEGAAIAATRAVDTVKVAQSDGPGTPPYSWETLERTSIWMAQTPQVFRRETLLQALGEAARDDYSGTDCASLVERLLDGGGESYFPVRLVEGSARNFKITFAADLERAEREMERPQVLGESQ